MDVHVCTQSTQAVTHSKIADAWCCQRQRSRCASLGAPVCALCVACRFIYYITNSGVAWRHGLCPWRHGSVQCTTSDMWRHHHDGRTSCVWYHAHDRKLRITSDESFECKQAHTTPTGTLPRTGAYTHAGTAIGHAYQPSTYQPSKWPLSSLLACTMPRARRAHSAQAYQTRCAQKQFGDDAGTAMGTELGVVIVRECTCMRAGATALAQRLASLNSRLRPLNVQPNFSARKAGLKRQA